MKRSTWRQSLTNRTRPQLLTVLLLLGMLSLPVECTMVAGPHSMFVNTATVAALQHSVHPGEADQGASARMPHHHASQAETPHQQDEDSPPLPTPAEMAGSSLTAIDVPGFSPLVTASSMVLVDDYVVSVLVERPSQGPDRPPP